MKVTGLKLLALIFLFTSISVAQGSDPAASIRREHWVVGALVSGGSGIGDTDQVQMVRAGARIGRVMTGQLGPGILRGTFELDAEIMPVDYVLWGGYRNIYGIGINPIVMKWNFTRGERAIPYFVTQGGLLWSTEHVPPGDTSVFNFTTGAGIGMNYFIRPRRSVSVDVRAIHLSNASIGDHNPGVNSSLQLSLGYNWWRQ